MNRALEGSIFKLHIQRAFFLTFLSKIVGPVVTCNPLPRTINQPEHPTRNAHNKNNNNNNNNNNDNNNNNHSTVVQDLG